MDSSFQRLGTSGYPALPPDWRSETCQSCQSLSTRSIACQLTHLTSIWTDLSPSWSRPVNRSTTSPSPFALWNVKKPIYLSETPFFLLADAIHVPLARSEQWTSELFIFCCCALTAILRRPSLSITSVSTILNSTFKQTSNFLKVTLPELTSYLVIWLSSRCTYGNSINRWFHLSRFSSRIDFKTLHRSRPGASFVHRLAERLVSW